MSRRWRGQVRRVALAGSAVLGLLLGGCAGARDDSAQGAVAEPWLWEMPECVTYDPADYPAVLQHRIAVERVHTEPELLIQVETFQPGWGAPAIGEIELVVGRVCERYEAGGTGDPEAFVEQHLIVERDFAADQALLVETVRLRPPLLQTWCTTVVRRGEQLATVRVDHSDPAQEQCRPAVDPALQALRTYGAAEATEAAGPA